MSALTEAYKPLQAWLFDHALPLWAERGVDRQAGGFFEKIALDGRATNDPRRTRLVARQVFSFAAAGEMGWGGPHADLVAHGLDFLTGKCLGESGLAYSVVAPDGSLIRADFDTYDHAFALFALATAAEGGHRTEACSAVASTMLAAMRAGFANPVAGFYEAVPPTPFMLANPHMHLFEAALAWLEVRPEDPEWNGLADEIGRLALSHLVDRQSGAIRETWDLEWMPSPDPERGHVVEPGHQFEWAWLLLRWARLRDDSIAKAAGHRLIEIGEKHGIDTEGLCLNALDPSFAVTDPNRRLWPQTERIKANLSLGEEARAAEALRGLARYFETPVEGLWFETLLPDGSVVPEAARGSSLYHIICALREVHRYLDKTR